MELQQKGESDGDYDNPHIPEDYYVGKLTGEFKTYERDDDAVGLITFFEITQGDQVGVQLPLFTPANLSVPRDTDADDVNASRLASQLQNLGVLESVLEILDCRDQVMSGEARAIVQDPDDSALDDLQTAIKGALSGREIRFHVEDNRAGDASQVSKLQKVFDEDDTET